MGKTKAEIQKRHQEILVELDKIDELAQRENRPFTAEENDKYNALLREDNRLHAEIQGMLDEHELNQMREQKAKGEVIREIFKKCREDKMAFSEDMHDREAANGTTILLNPAAGNTKGNIEASGAIPMTIHELIDTKVPGLELPGDLKILTGVTGNQVWPYAIDDVEFTVAGEVEQIGEQKINFDKLNASPVHVAAALAISNNAIDNSDFDLYSFCQYKMTKGLAKFKALYAYSHCDVQHALKPVFSLVTVEEITLDDNFGENLAGKIAEMWDKGFEGDPWLTMSKTSRPSCSSRRPSLAQLTRTAPSSKVASASVTLTPLAHTSTMRSTVRASQHPMAISTSVLVTGATAHSSSTEPSALRSTQQAPKSASVIPQC